MTARLDPNLRHEIARYGGGDVAKCMNCGGCTATCDLTETGQSFPRGVIHQLQVGMTDKLESSAEPWLCYYCGDCSDQCPRDANPGETMMAARRYLTSRYDWTGLARKMYTSAAWEIGALLAVALTVVGIFALFHGPMNPDRVEINAFAPVAWVELGDLVMAGLLGAFLISNLVRMHRFFFRGQGGLRAPLKAYLVELKTLFTHFATQKRWRECKGEKPIHWFKHLLLVTGYATMFLLVVVFLRWFQTDEVRPIWHPTRLLGYYATFVLFYVSVDMMIGRLRKRKRLQQYSHLSDWLFLILLFLTTLTGIALHAFRLANWPMPTYYIYVIHLAIAVAMLMVEVPFGKWSHLAYRPFAMYLVRVRDRARQMAAAPAAG